MPYNDGAGKDSKNLGGDGEAPKKEDNLAPSRERGKQEISRKRLQIPGCREEVKEGRSPFD